MYHGVSISYQYDSLYTFRILSYYSVWSLRLSCCVYDAYSWLFTIFTIYHPDHTSIFCDHDSHFDICRILCSHGNDISSDKTAHSTGKSLIHIFYLFFPCKLVSLVSRMLVSLHSSMLSRSHMPLRLRISHFVLLSQTLV